MSEERKLILKLGQMITDRIGHKVTVDGDGRSMSVHESKEADDARGDCEKIR